MKKTVRWWIGFVLVLIISVGAIFYTIYSLATLFKITDEPKRTYAITDENEIAYKEIDLQTMLDDLEENALRAENNYQNAYIQFSGQIANIDSDGKYISVEPIGSKAFIGNRILCDLMNDNQRNFVMSKNKGDQVTIKGKITSIGEILGYSLDIIDIQEPIEAEQEEQSKNLTGGQKIESEIGEKLEYGYYTLPSGYEIRFNPFVRYDTTGNWRISVTYDETAPTEYAVEYYKTVFFSDDEVHFIWSTKLGTMTRIAVSGNDLSVTTHEHVNGEEGDAKILGSGAVLDERVVDIAAWEAENPDLKKAKLSATNIEAQRGEPTLGEKNAEIKARGYLDIMPFSRSGLIAQLEFEGFTNEEAIYGVDQCNANWNEQAARKAKGYLDIMGFSRQGLINQLEFDGFTSQQAEYGASAVGY